MQNRDSQHRRFGRSHDEPGWYGDSRGHAEAARKGWEHRRAGGSSYDEDDDRGYLIHESLGSRFGGRVPELGDWHTYPEGYVQTPMRSMAHLREDYRVNRRDRELRMNDREHEFQMNRRERELPMSRRERDRDYDDRVHGGWFVDVPERAESNLTDWENLPESRRSHYDTYDYGKYEDRRNYNVDRNYNVPVSDRRGWFGDPEGHAEAAERGWANRRGDFGTSSRGRRHEHGGWYGDHEGHSEAALRGWENRRREFEMSRGRGQYGSSDEGREHGRGWFGDPEGHAEAAERGWAHRRGDVGMSERGRGHGRGQVGERVRHAVATRRGWEEPW